MKKIVTIILVFLLASCTRTVYIPQVEVRTDSVSHTEYIHHRDTVYQSEKIVTINDTVYITKYKYVGKESSNVKTDTVIRTDSIPYPVEVPVEVEVIRYRTPGWVWCFFIMLAVGIAGFIWHRIKAVRDALR